MAEDGKPKFGRRAAGGVATASRAPFVGPIPLAVSDLPDDPTPSATPRPVPPTGWRIALVLTAIILGIALVCLSCVIGYMFYVDARQR